MSEVATLQRGREKQFSLSVFAVSLPLISSPWLDEVELACGGAKASWPSRSSAFSICT